MATQQDWWQQDALAPSADPNFGGFIQGPPKAKEPKSPVFVPKDATQMFNPNTGEYEPVPQAPPAQVDPAEQENLRNEALAKIKLAGSLIKRSREGWFTTGFGAGVAGAVGGTPAYGVKQDTETLKSAGALQRIMEMSTKAGKNLLTPISNSDFQALASSISNLDVSQPDDQYQHNVRTVIDIYRRAYVNAGGNAADVDKLLKDEGADVAAPAATPAPSGGGSGGGGSGMTAGNIELTPEQTQAYKAFIASVGGKPTGQQVKSFLEGLLPGQTVTDADKIAARIAQTGEFSTTGKQLDYEQRVRERLQQENKVAPTDPATTLITQGGTLNLSDEAAGVGSALAGLFTGDTNLGSNYRLGRDVERARIADAREQLGYGGTALEIIGGAASANPSAALAPFTTRELVMQGIKSGGVGGGVAGFGAGEGTNESLAGAGVGAAAGAGVGVLAPFLPRALPRRFRAPQGMAPDVGQAAREEGVDLIRPMVDQRSIPAYGELESNQFSQPIIRAGTERTREQIANATESLGGDGTPLDTGAAGELVQSAGRRFIQNSKNVADRLYNRARSLAGDTRFTPQTAIDQIDAELAQLAPNAETNAGEISFLEGLKRDLSTPGGKTVEELRQLRTSLRGRLTEQNLTATQAEARAIRAMDATQQDVAANAPNAASAYRRADTYYRERQTHIDDIIKRVTGGKVGNTDYVLSGEQAFQRLKTMTSPGGDGRRLAALMRDLSPSERQDIAATFAHGLGREAPDQPFSAARFLSQTNKLSPSARRTIFGPDGARSIQNLRTLSQALKDAGQDINQSRSGTYLERAGMRRAAFGFISALTGLGTGAGALTGAGGTAGAITGAVVAGTSMAANAGLKRLSARAMVNPRVTQWLADAATVSTPRQAAEATRRLGSIISREPALAQELRPIYQYLTGDVTPALAAQPNGQEDAGNE